MNPTPARSTHWATASGDRSILAPRASNTSALPLREVAERLPCLATETPAPATTNAAAVETLNVERPPPVPQVSTSGVLVSQTDALRARTTEASPASSAAVSPFARSAIRNAPV